MRYHLLALYPYLTVGESRFNGMSPIKVRGLPLQGLADGFRDWGNNDFLASGFTT